MTEGLNAVWSNNRAAPTYTNPKNLELAPPQSVTATRLDQKHHAQSLSSSQTYRNHTSLYLTLNPDKTTCTLCSTDPAEYKSKVLGLTLDPKLTTAHTFTTSQYKHTRHYKWSKHSQQQDGVNRRRHPWLPIRQSWNRLWSMSLPSSTRINGSNDSRMHVVEPSRGWSFIWQIGVNSSIQEQRQVWPRCFGVKSVMRVNADSLLIRAATTSTSGTFNDLTTDLIIANNNNQH